ncbi:5763_t:CDS:2 [Ambispora leptoticha]|uniref:5763_t:CDS:1 n=1 Tax=Ambispora leptoticha TaxID=144679 RepID=A0A9N8V702_9GLOM|nr:5763_t:CDS:2 [Ambispora leptoticha]
MNKLYEREGCSECKDLEGFCRQKCDVAIKRANSTIDVEEILNELSCLYEINLHAFENCYIFGISQDPETKAYLIVLPFAENGDLRSYLLKNPEMKWRNKLILIYRALETLCLLHDDGYVHRDMHSGNILCKNGAKAEIADFGLSLSLKGHTKESGIYGVLPYVAPEVLCGSQYSQASDIYGIGIVLSEVANGGIPVFSGVKFDSNLAMSICQGLRPSIPDGTPKEYVELVKQCWDADPKKRPTARQISEQIKNFWSNAKCLAKFDQADGIAKRECANRKLDSFDPIDPSKTHTSTLLKFDNLPEPTNSSQIFSMELQISSNLDFDYD